jgi:hypothetical protein
MSAGRWWRAYGRCSMWSYCLSRCRSYGQRFRRRSPAGRHPAATKAQRRRREDLRRERSSAERRPHPSRRPRPEPRTARFRAAIRWRDLPELQGRDCPAWRDCPRPPAGSRRNRLRGGRHRRKATPLRPDRPVRRAASRTRATTPVTRQAATLRTLDSRRRWERRKRAPRERASCRRQEPPARERRTRTESRARERRTGPRARESSGKMRPLWREDCRTWGFPAAMRAPGPAGGR